MEDTFTASADQINLWHHQVNLHCQQFLRTYDLDCGTLAYDAFKVGVDTKNHALTFAVDDTRYLKIDLNDSNTMPLDDDQAQTVLRIVNNMRFKKNSNFSY